VPAACSQIVEDHQPQLRRHLILHLPDVRDIDLNCTSIPEMGEIFIWRTLARVHYDEGRLEEAEQLEIQAMETRKTKLGEDYPDTLASMANLDASILCKSITSNLQNLLYPVGQVKFIQKTFCADQTSSLILT
jgi:hypothetical protein